ncbi:hypothetical protein CHU_1533 [Cytophaga hutchinsonii ATCC 33406]|uniref:Uncharacterized protein n=1 Tax=Cytophaga hutchinsonii (strain ATCC 33406 / DSM 1761 / CIP 103989 / NBRC 15051 / NCIMB 9469 / D465) TaxID=269798 RepID=A0A6N4SR84_CYTH3|nr:hypothetical protein CHU_1533 [Cytophaga hutchinsonii ATCC 33406]
MIIGTVSTVFFNLAIHHFISPAHGFNRGQINEDICIDYLVRFQPYFLILPSIISSHRPMV